MSQSPKKRGLSPYDVEYSSPKKAKINPFTPGVAGTIRIATETHTRNKKNSVRGGSSSSSTNLIPSTNPKLKPKKHDQQSTDDSTTSPVNSLGNSSGVSSEDVTDAPETPLQKIGNSQLEKTPSSNISSTGSKSDVDSAGTNTRLQLFEEKQSVTMELRLGNEDYVVRIQKRSISTSTNENRKEDANQLTKNPGMSDILCNMLLEKVVDQIAANYHESIQHHLLANSVPKIGFPDQ